MSHQTFRLCSLTSFFPFVPSSLLHLRSFFTSSPFISLFHTVFTLFTSSLLHRSFHRSFSIVPSSLFFSTMNSWKPSLHFFLLRVAPCIFGFRNFKLFFLCCMFFLCFIYLFIYFCYIFNSLFCC